MPSATFQVAALQNNSFNAPYTSGGITLNNAAGNTHWNTGSERIVSEGNSPAGGSFISLSGPMTLASNGAGLDLADHFDKAWSGATPGALAYPFSDVSLNVSAQFAGLDIQALLVKGGTATGTYEWSIGVNIGYADVFPPGTATPEPATWAVWMVLGGVVAFARRRALGS